MKRKIKILILVICALLCISVLASCSESTLMSYEDKTLSLNVYEFLLSRMKGTLAYYGYNVNSSAFWNMVNDMDGTTYDDYFCQTIKEQAMNYIVADKIFDENGLVLSDSDQVQIDSLMDAYVKKAGSKSALNAELKEFGVNYDMLREIYVLEAKIELLKEHLYGKNGDKIDDTVKEEYFNENYVAFKQIFLATYEYVIDEDRFGDHVYYTDEKHKEIAYDKKNGVTKTDEFGKTVKDVLGDPEYYTSDGKIAYDKVNGVLGYAADDDGNKVIKELDDAKKAEILEKAEEYAEKCDGNIAVFEEYAEIYNEGEGSGTVYLYSSAGYYASQNDAVAYFDEIAEELEGMDSGDCSVYKSNYGYHVLCRYENESGAYDKKENEDVFKSFYEDLSSRLFEKLCAERATDVIIDKDVFADAPTMKDVGINTAY